MLVFRRKDRIEVLYKDVLYSQLVQERKNTETEEMDTYLIERISSTVSFFERGRTITPKILSVPLRDLSNLKAHSEHSNGLVGSCRFVMCWSRKGSCETLTTLVLPYVLLRSRSGKIVSHRDVGGGL